MMATLRRFLKDRRANSATEFAFILPVMLTFIIGIVEFGRFFQAYDGVSRLASRYASAYADCNDNPNNASPSPQNCNTELGLYWPAAAIKNIAPQLTNGTPAVRMFEVQYSLTGTATIVYQYPSGATMTASETQRAQAAIFYPGASTPPIGVLVSVSYTHAFIFGSSLVQNMFSGIASKLAINYTIAQRKI